MAAVIISGSGNFTDQRFFSCATQIVASMQFGVAAHLQFLCRGASTLEYVLLF